MINENYQIKNENIDWGNFNANVQFLDETGLLREGIRILEIGCGAGRLTNYLARKGFNVIGFDISRGLIKEGYIRYPNTTILHASGDSMPFRGAFFDVIISFDVIEHISNVNAHFSEVRRVLKPDGFYLFQTPNKITNIIYEVIKNRSFTKHKKYHCSLQTFWSLKRLLDAHDFESKFVKIAIMNEFMRQKIKKVFGRVGVYLL